MALHRSAPGAASPKPLSVNPRYGRTVAAVPRHALPDGEMDPVAAQRIVRDELLLDGNARRLFALGESDD